MEVGEWGVEGAVWRCTVLRGGTKVLVFMCQGGAVAVGRLVWPASAAKCQASTPHDFPFKLLLCFPLPGEGPKRAMQLWRWMYADRNWIRSLQVCHAEQTMGKV